VVASNKVVLETILMNTTRRKTMYYTPANASGKAGHDDQSQATICSPVPGASYMQDVKEEVAKLFDADSGTQTQRQRQPCSSSTCSSSLIQLASKLQRAASIETFCASRGGLVLGTTDRTSYVPVIVVWIMRFSRGDRLGTVHLTLGTRPRFRSLL
jgi:hypothetical protein